MARSSRAICEGPSSPIDTPQCEPTKLTLVCEMAPIRICQKIRCDFHLMPLHIVLARETPDCEQTYLIVSAAEEGSKGRHECYRAVSARSSNSDTHDVLLGNVALDQSVGVDALDLVGECRVFGVAVQCNHAWMVLGQLQQKRMDWHGIGCRARSNREERYYLGESSSVSETSGD